MKPLEKMTISEMERELEAYRIIERKKQLLEDLAYYRKQKEIEKEIEKEIADAKKEPESVL